MKKNRLVAVWIIALCLAFSINAFAKYLDIEDPFFSYKRFYLQLDILNDVSDDKNIRNDIKAFVRNLAAGIYAISADDLKKAKVKLLKARAIWPEYFGTDFLLARANEDTGNYKLSAQFYKSYLNKLKALSEGSYRISAPLIRGITPYRIEDYDDAYAYVQHRLKDHGIDLAVVQPFYTMPGFLKLLIALVILGSGYAVMAYGVIPYIKRLRHINNPPEGMWVCKKCDAYNFNIRVECEKCGEIRSKITCLRSSHK
ncbi:MAG: zinc finger Ran-binding domain-containing protein [Candidatus Omnitrophica bacterium]|nr:zinc finger Ran-binding domain-containing protein [Candidatus Omnitrophota bacterium]MBU1808787.1 zinc finger Ran-binding domain-containing protein [Candidatus Omnitrophota bacterium]